MNWAELDVDFEQRVVSKVAAHRKSVLSMQAVCMAEPHRTAAHWTVARW